ncbi:hypothetical protein B296_00019341 [Ensete ventricosum]|uniref:Uncharacterized protein n=1 Tax=Ensete ventricosum TaxID=4639 RepID=A0A427A291_ENSVE|nr:hypothetical protein B296_00019341 [Ensete ventricosum]
MDALGTGGSGERGREKRRGWCHYEGLGFFRWISNRAGTAVLTMEWGVVIPWVLRLLLVFRPLSRVLANLEDSRNMVS